MSATMSNYMSANSFFIVGHHVSHYASHHVHLHVGRHISHLVNHRKVVATVCEVSEMLTEWKSKSITYERTYRRTDQGRC